MKFGIPERRFSALALGRTGPAQAVSFLRLKMSKSSPGRTRLRHGCNDAQTARPGSGRFAPPSLTAWLLAALMVLATAGGLQAQSPAEEFAVICETGTVEALAEAVKAGADVNAPAQGLTPLMRAALDPSTAAAKAEILLKAGADPNARTDTGQRSVLHLAVFGGSLDLIKMLLAAGADLEALDDYGRTPLVQACMSSPLWPEGRQEELVRLLLDSGAEVNPPPTGIPGLDPELPLVWAAFDCGPEVVKMLLAAGCPVNGAGPNGLTPLMTAAQGNFNPDTVTALLEAGADVTLRTTGDLTALDYALIRDVTPAVEKIRAILTEAMAAAAG